VNPERLRAELRAVPVPGAEAAEARGRRVVLAAFEERRGSAFPPYVRKGTAAPPLASRRRRFALALAAVTLLAALLLSPAGASVRHWIGGVFTAGVPGAERDLRGVPGRGQLLVQSRRGPWVVKPDGSRRLLGDYDAAAWSPHGLYLAVASGRTLSAVEPDGAPHWSLTAPGPVADPRWSPSGYRIAYRSGRGLWVVAGDGSGARRLDPRVEPVPPSWSASGLPLLAYADGGGRTVVRSAAGGVLASAPSLSELRELEWGGWGTTILEASARALWLRPVRSQKLAGGVHLAPPERIPLPLGRLRQAALAPGGASVAVLIERGTPAAPRAEVDLIDRRGGAPHRLFAAASRLGQIAWSPGGRRLLITWPAADQWLFVPTHGRGRIHAVSGISRAFSPGSRGAFPSVAGWCCRR
jgi:hypothetical protein